MPLTATYRSFLGLLLAVALLAAAVTAAHGVGTQGTPTSTPSHPDVNAISSYTFGQYALRGQDIVFEYELTFPAGFDVTDVMPVSPAATIVSKDTTTRTIRFLLDESWSRPDRVLSFTVSGVKNPPTAGTYQMPNIRFLVGQQNRPNQAPVWESVVAGPITIVQGYLSLTITTPADGQQVVFGTVDPGVASPAQQVVIAVDSSVGYLISRALGGDATLMGLAVDGVPVDIQPAGTASFTDSYTITPPWTSDPEIEYSATVAYTVVQQ